MRIRTGGSCSERRRADGHTSPQRVEIFRLIAEHYAEAERKYQEDGTDYPLVPGGTERAIDMTACASDTMLRDDLDELFAKAGIPKRKGDWMGFHAARRGFADVILSKEGLESASAGLGHNSMNTTKIYVGEYDHGRISRNRLHMEAEEQDES
jgi:hypothetical protein